MSDLRSGSRTFYKSRRVSNARYRRMATARSRTYDMVYIGMFVVLMAICSWISIPMVIPVTLQTFAVFLAIVVLG